MSSSDLLSADGSPALTKEGSDDRDSLSGALFSSASCRRFRVWPVATGSVDGALALSRHRKQGDVQQAGVKLALEMPRQLASELLTSSPTRR